MTVTRIHARHVWHRPGAVHTQRSRASRAWLSGEATILDEALTGCISKSTEIAELSATCTEIAQQRVAADRTDSRPSARGRGDPLSVGRSVSSFLVALFEALLAHQRVGVHDHSTHHPLPKQGGDCGHDVSTGRGLSKFAVRGMMVRSSGEVCLPQVRRATMLVVVLVLLAGGIAAGAVADHRHKNGRMGRADVASWYCQHRNQRCQEPQAEVIEASWQQRERVYRVSFWVASLGAVTALVLRLRGWQNVVMSRFAANSESDQLALAQCVGCGLEADARFTVAENWTWWAAGEGELVPHCPACSRQRFGHRTTMTDDLLASVRHPLRQDSGDIQERRLRLLDIPSEVPDRG